MEAGRKLDAEVAEKVLGRTVVRNKKGGWSIGEAEWDDYAGDMQLRNPLPAYSEDIASAMEVFEHLRNSHRFCCLNISSDYNYCWDVNLTKESLSEDPSGHKPCVTVGGYDSLPLAICVAALRAMEVK